MKPILSPPADRDSVVIPSSQGAPANGPPRRFSLLALLPLAATIGLFAFVFFPPVRDNPNLVTSFIVVSAALFVWQVILFAVIRRRKRTLPVEVVVLRSHYVQALVQFCIYVYWGSHSSGVVAQAPLIFAQLIYLNAFSALMAWSRGRVWQLGFGPFPIIFSTNLLLWFRPDWFMFQFLMVTAGALGKEFIQWRRDGRKTHIFNPSVFGQVLAAIVLIITGSTTKYTLGEEIAVSFESLPHIMPLLFVLGLVVQSLFSVTLMTLSATAMLCLINLVFTAVTGTYYFVTLNIGATIFLGLHLLMTDPSTSPRSNVGRVIFGALYGFGYAILFRVFEGIGVSLFWDKLLPVPILNLSVPLLDRMARTGIVGRLNRRWEGSLTPRKLNFVHMGVWTALFLTMMGTGFVHAPHPGRSIGFWRTAYEEGRYRAGENLRLLVTHGAAHGSGEACNMLGKLHLEGDLVAKDDAAAAHWFAESCRLGYGVGCENVAGQFLFQHRAESPEAAEMALSELEKYCGLGGDGTNCFLVGLAYELGLGRAHDVARARELYEQGCARGNRDACTGLQRLGGAKLPKVDER